MMVLIMKRDPNKAQASVVTADQGGKYDIRSENRAQQTGYRRLL